MTSYKINYIFVSLIYSIIFVYIIPWTELKNEEFIDLLNYTNRVVYLLNGGKEKEFFGISFLFSEVLWKYILIYLTILFKDPFIVVALISFISLFIYTYIILRRTNNYFLLILLFNPLFIELIMGQIRIAFAFALFLIAYELLINNKLKILAFIIIIVVPLIHTGMLIVITVFLYIHFFNSYFKNIKTYYFWAVVTALFISLLLKYGVDILLVNVGDKRANYSQIIEASSIKYSFFWFILSILIFMYSNSIKKDENNIIIFSIIMMCIFFFSSLIGVYGQRYVAISIPFILLSISFLKQKYQIYLYSLLFIYLLVQHYYWMKIFDYI
jgi:hypothetical protein